MKTDDLNQSVKRFSNKLKANWQILFIVMIVLYGTSLYHSLKVNPALREQLSGYQQNLDLISFIIAIALAVLILNLKRKYFSKKFSREITESALAETRQLSDRELLKKVFARLQTKLLLIWILGLLIVLDGVVLYWLTFLSHNMHIYFIVGTFSLILNYPRRELFAEIPWYIREARKDFDEQSSP